MPYLTPTVSDFKEQFPRDFPYAVPAWGARVASVLTAGVIGPVTVVNPGQGYKQPPTVVVVDPSGVGAQLTAVVTAGKVTGITVVNGGTGYSDPRILFLGGAGDDTDLTRVTDNDITGGIFDASFNVSRALFNDQALWSRAYLYLAAHCMVEKMLMAGEGLASQYNWLTQSKTVGNVNESFLIPERIMKDPMLAAFSKTRYGAMYLQIISPLLVGAMFASHRESLP